MSSGYPESREQEIFHDSAESSPAEGKYYAGQAVSIQPAPALSPDYGLKVVAPCELPTPWATFRLHAFVEQSSGREHLALTLGGVDDDAPVLARIHSACLTGDALFSRRCDCGAQLEAALKKIAAEERGVLLYLQQKGRGIGLANKIHAYRMQDAGADTVQANHALGFAADLRRYDLCRPMLDHLGIAKLRLLTNNPRKIEALRQLGMQVVERIPLIAGKNPFNERYLATKASKLGHWM
jgi:GTP cyclohydrolase II